MQLEKIQHVITVKAAFMIFALTAAATVIRPILIQQDIAFTLIGIVNSILLWSFYYFLLKSPVRSWHGLSFAVVGLCVLFPLIFISGGVNSQFSYILPLVPSFLALISTRRHSVLFAIIIFVLTIVMHQFQGVFPDFTNEVVSDSKTAARTFWLCLAIIFSTLFSIEFSRLNTSLSDKLTKQAELDALTGIRNRRSLMNFMPSALEQHRQNNQSLAVLMIDADHFKAINDQFGHHLGDRCLKRLAKIIDSSIRKTTDCAARYGGEEFAAVLTNISEQDALKIAEKMRSAIEQSKVTDEHGNEVGLTVTIGVACSKGSDELLVESLIESADRALYSGKQQGRNRVVLA